MDPPTSLTREISPPPNPSRRKSGRAPAAQASRQTSYVPLPMKSAKLPTVAAVEAGKAVVDDHLTYFSEHLAQFTKPVEPGVPRLSIEDFKDLYQRNQNSRGHHFVIHQHDHPIAGVHYDLRLQFSESSSCSWACMKGLPGDANSRQIRRNATETRVHNYWNHLIESGSHASGSMLVWDTGEYEVLDKDAKPDKPPATDDELSEISDSGYSKTSTGFAKGTNSKSENEKLAEAFNLRHIRLRLHGVRLPPGYTISLRLQVEDDRIAQPPRPPRKRRRREPSELPRSGVLDTESETESGLSRTTSRRGSPLVSEAGQEEETAIGNASDEEAEDEEIRRTNAYTGSTNTIGSIHQRRWFITLDRLNSGFERVNKGREKGRYIRRQLPKRGLAGWEPFQVLGRDVERSVVTGRLAADVMADEGVENYVGRKMWRPVTI